MATLADLLTLAEHAGVFSAQQERAAAQQQQQHAAAAAAAAELVAAANKSPSLITSFLDVSSQLRDSRVQLQQAKAMQADGDLASAAVLQQRAAAVGEARTTLARVVADKDAVLERLQQPHAGPCLGVDNSQQPSLHWLLLSAAAHREQVGGSAGSVAWATGFGEPPTAWAQALQPLARASKGAQRYMEALGGGSCDDGGALPTTSAGAMQPSAPMAAAATAAAVAAGRGGSGGGVGAS